MEYAISRAHEIKRLSYENMISLKVYEKNAGRCLMPHEIQARFNLPPAKTAYLIPEIEAGQAQHSARIQNDFYLQKIYPAFGYLSSLDIDRAHQFDQAISESNIDFVYSGGSKKSKFREQLED